jgi:microsomal dipeptidase-like Zn-dependent dipeptidase
MPRVNSTLSQTFLHLLFLCNSIWLFSFKANAQIDLHAHLHMKPGMGPMIGGQFHDDPRADHWSDRFQMRASGKSLSETPIAQLPRLIVISFYGHPYFAYSFEKDGFAFDRKAITRRAVEQQYTEFKQFIDQHAQRFAIARNAKEARSIIQSGKTAIVLSIEGAWGHFESSADYQKWIQDRGIAIVTPVHMTPDDLGGNALMSNIISFANSTLDFLASVWQTRGSCLKTFCKSTLGFTTPGEDTLNELIRNDVWIDLAHMSENQVKTMIPKLEKSKFEPLPLLVTHTQLRQFYPFERGLGQLEVEYIRKVDGIVGLIPSQHMLPEAMKQAHQEALLLHPEEAQAASAAKGLSCITSLEVFKKTVASAIATLGSPNRVALSSDINAPLDGLSPGCGDVSQLDDSMRDLYRRGYYTYTQWNTLARFSSPDSEWQDRHLEHFLVLWERVSPSH